jgi:hypothetical protein
MGKFVKRVWIFGRNLVTADDEVPDSGINPTFRITYKDLLERFGEGARQDIQTIDLVEILPFLENCIRPPKLVVTFLAEACEEFMRQDEDYYFPISPRVYGFYFSKTLKFVVDIKMLAIQYEIIRLVREEFERRKSLFPEGYKPDDFWVDEEGEKMPELPDVAKMAEKEVWRKPPKARSRRSKSEYKPLPPEATDKELQDWMTRALDRMVGGGRYYDLENEIDVMADGIKAVFQPVMHVKHAVISGYVCADMNPPVYVWEDDTLRNDLAVLAASVRALREAVPYYSNVVVIAPVAFSTLTANPMRDLISVYLWNLPAEIKKHLVLEIGSFPKRKVSVQENDSLRMLAFHCRAIMVNTGLHDKIPEGIHESIKIHGYGFDMTRIQMEEQQMMPLLRAYAEELWKYEARIFVRGVGSTDLLKSAIVHRFDYVAGSAVAEMEKFPRPAHKARIPDMKNMACPCCKKQLDTYGYSTDFVEKRYFAGDSEY